MNNIIFFGPPGAGKGTQANLIAKHLNIPHLSTGEVLRNKILENDNLALELKAIMSSGRLVSDEILNKIVSTKLLKDCKNGFILDGYPRSLDQAYFLDNFLNDNRFELGYIFNIHIEFELLKSRIIRRSNEEDRDDDNLGAIQIRYDTYLESTKPVSDYYKKKYSKIYYDIDGSDEIDRITNKLIKIIKKS